VQRTGLLLDLVAMLVIDVHMGNGPQVRHLFFSSLQEGAPATPFSLLKMANIATSPINCFAPVEYWQNTPNIRSPSCRLESGGAENCIVTTTQKRSNTLLSAALRPIQQLFLDLPVSAMRVIIF
jgi:hypothetical protein